MIISFNQCVFQSQDMETQKTLAKIIMALMENHHHLIDFKSIRSVFYNENNQYVFDLNEISNLHMSVLQRRILKEFLSKESHRNITSLHNQHLVRIIVGMDEKNNEIHPYNAHKIIKERSKILVENGINDWKFIKGICQKYSSAKIKRRSIYKMIDEAIKNEFLEAEHCGGIGDIKKITQKWINSSRYKSIFKYKLMAVFDSDREKSDEVTKHKDKIKYFKQLEKEIENIINYEYEFNDLIVWHVLYKRKIENYIPLSILLNHLSSITQVQKRDLESKTNEELDFLEYGENNIGIGKSKIKDQFPSIFLHNFSYRDFEKRCEHHKTFLELESENISEIEQILLKIVKIL